MADPTIEFKQWQRDNEKRAREKENAKKKEQAEKKRLKDQSKFRNQIYDNNREIDRQKTIISNVGISLTTYIELYNQANRDARDPGSPGGATISLEEQAAIDSALSVVNNLKATRQAAKNRIDELEKDNITLRKKLEETFKPDPWQKEAAKNSGPGSSKPKNPKTPESNGNVDLPKGYKYNLPLLKNAWHNPLGPQALALDANTVGNFVINPGNYKDALKAWTGARPGRGTMQVNKTLFQSTVNSAVVDNKLKPNLDLNMYGFKFLYNPKEINMSYNILSNLNPEFAESGRDEFAPIVPHASYISFNILLNRIEDMDYVTETGLRPNVVNPYGVGKTALNTEAAQIYAKGTMYDLEYFFKMNHAPSATFITQLNIETADKGYLLSRIIELHLGASMRYRIRVTGLSITHLIFNPRMVPVLTSVKFDCARVIDRPTPESQKNFRRTRTIGTTNYTNYVTTGEVFR